MCVSISMSGSFFSIFLILIFSLFSFFFFFNDTATTEIYTLSLHDALPIFPPGDRHDHPGRVHLRGGGGNIFLVAGPGARLGHEADNRAGELMALRWYVVHAYSNFEHRVAESLKERIQRAGLSERFGEILVPTEEVVEMRDGQKRKSERKFYPGYVLVQMEMDEE